MAKYNFVSQSLVLNMLVINTFFVSFWFKFYVLHILLLVQKTFIILFG